MLSERDLFISKDTNSLKVKEGKKYIPACINKKNREAKRNWDKIDFKLKTVVKDKRHYILIKRSIHQEYVIAISMYTNNRAQKYVKETLIENREFYNKS